MPITFAHLPFVFLFFVMVALPCLVSLLLLLIPASRLLGKRLFCGSTGAALGLVGYQLAYIPVCIGLVLIGALVGQYLPSSVIAASLLLIFYVVWFFALLFGYVSGFRVGWCFAKGIPLIDSVRRDWLSRTSLACVAHLRRKKS